MSDEPVCLGADRVKGSDAAQQFGVRQVPQLADVGGRSVRGTVSEQHGEFGDAVQRREGMYMIGQVAGLRDRVCTIDALHRDVASGRPLIAAQLSTLDGGRTSASRSDIAIVGLSCVLPKAGTVDRFWHNVLTKFNAIGEDGKSIDQFSLP